MKNKKGFTLVELLVSIAIMGILLIVTLPQVNKIKEENKLKKYETYKESLERAAKLYTDSNGKDMFGYASSGCQIIEYSQLEKANLIKKFQEKNIDCSNKNTYVAVKKANSEYLYETQIYCYKDGKTEPQYHSGKVNRNSCINEEDNTSPTISVTPESQEWVQTKNSKDIKVVIKDTGLGLNKNISIKYQWSENKTNPSSKWKTMNFLNKEKGLSKISKKISNSNLPQDTGEYYLHIIPISVMDIMANEIPNAQITFGPYKFDNEKPTVSLANSGITITGNASDSASGLKSYYFGTKECKSLKDSDYSNTSTSININETKSDGKTYYLCAKDKADNIGQTSITTYKECSKTINNGWQDSTTCNVKCGTGTKTQILKYYDMYTHNECSSMQESKNVSCDTGIDCCSSTKTTCGNWAWTECSKECDGTKKQKRTCTLKSTYNDSICGTKTETRNENTSCNDCSPINKKVDCKIRGNQKLSGDSWTCDHNHTVKSWYRVYSSDENGKLTRCTNSLGPILACPKEPYSEDTGWYVIDDSACGSNTTSLKWNGKVSKCVPSKYTIKQNPNK